MICPVCSKTVVEYLQGLRHEDGSDMCAIKGDKEMTPPNPREEELSKETQSFIRTMLRDHAFSEEFLLTAIQEYFQRNFNPEKITV